LKRINIILNRDFGELRKTNAFFIILIVFAVITIAAALTIGILLKQKEWISHPASKPVLEIIISVTAYFLPVLIFMTFIWSFASLPLVKEKVSGAITSLLATPLKPGELLTGKSLNIFFPGFVISTISTFIVLLAINFIAIVPATGDYILPAPALVTGLVLNPLLFLGLIFLLVLFSLAGNPDIAITPSFVIGFGLMMGIPLGLATGKIDLTSWSFSLWYLAGIIIFWIIILCFLPLLTKEKIILSSKGTQM